MSVQTIKNKFKVLAIGIVLIFTGCSHLTWSETECIDITMVEICLPIGEKPAFVDEFKLVTPTRINLNKGLMKNKLGISDKDLLELEESSELVKTWNKKINDARRKKKALYDDVKSHKKTWATEVPLKPALRITGNGSVIQNDEAHKAWVAYFEKNNDNPEFRCTWNNEEISCLEWIQTEKYKLFAELFNASEKDGAEKKLLLKYLGLTLRVSQLDLNPQGPYKVFLHNIENASPQIDNIGNLYISSNMIDSLSVPETQVVLNHEAAHVLELNDAVIAWLVADGLKQMHQKSNIAAEQIPMLDEFIAFIRQPDEAYIDLLAAYLFSENPIETQVSSDLISNLEGSVSPRRDVSVALTNAIRDGMSTRNVLRARILRQTYTCDGTSAQAFKKSWLDASATAIIYRNAFAKYQAYRVPSQMITIMGKNYAPLAFRSYSNYALTSLISNGCVDMPFNVGNANYVLKINSFNYIKP